jgi:hypothetical protein
MKSPTTIFFSILAVSGLAGCAADGAHYKEWSIEPLSIPKIGESSSAEIGDNLYAEYIGNFTYTYAVTLEEDVTVNSGGASFIMPKGAETDLLTEKKNGSVGKACFKNIEGIAPEEMKVGDTLIWRKQGTLCLLDENEDGTFDSATLNIYTDKSDGKATLSAPIKYTMDKKADLQLSATRFQREILYQGSANGVINVSYRELTNNMARPAFDQDVKYEISKDGSTIIAFKGVRIEVLSADNTSIKYRVIEPFRDSTLK